MFRKWFRRVSPRRLQRPYSGLRAGSDDRSLVLQTTSEKECNMVRVPILSWRVPRNDRALSRRRFLIQVGVIACFVLAWSVQPLWAGQFTEIVAFGDSLTDTGNAFAKSGNTRPDPNYYYQGRWSNGPIWVERLAS